MVANLRRRPDRNGALCRGLSCAGAVRKDLMDRKDLKDLKDSEGFGRIRKDSEGTEGMAGRGCAGGLAEG
jgi:hypothetical protein